MRQLTVMATATRPVGAEQPWARWPDHCKATNPRQRGSARDEWHDPAERHGMRWQNVLARDGETDSSRPCEGCKRRVKRDPLGNTEPHLLCRTAAPPSMKGTAQINP